MKHTEKYLTSDRYMSYRPIPFWSWNEKLNTTETKFQIHKMKEAGIGGFFMHARGGLQTEYMSKEWYDNVTAAVEEAEKCDMHAWAYDENGWPSGFGNGKVNGLGIAYQQKYLRMEAELHHRETAICKCGKHYFYYEINPFYVDTLDKQVVAKFIESSYEPYYEMYGNRMEGFFTDEPQISRDGIPWSFVFEEAYRERYQEDILTCLEQLFLPVGDYKNTRVKFWKMVTDLFSEAYMKQIYDWCNERNLKITGHLACEESLTSQITANGACMAHYEYFHIPGIDWLGRNIWESLTLLQVSSVAEQLGKEAVLSESFALCGHNVSFAELKGIYEWQMVRGINLLCQHLEGYSIRGIRKRDYPPAMYIQQPWWSECSKFNDAMSREGMILRDGKHHVDVLVLHPQSTAWAMFDNDKNEGIEELYAELLQTIKVLEKKHIEFHLGDETIMERHAKVQDGQLVVGEQTYSYIVNPGCEMLLSYTEKLLSEFQESGGNVVTAEELKANPIVDNEDITYTKRDLYGAKFHYFVNTSSERKESAVRVTGYMLDIYSGELHEFSGKHQFEPWGSLMVLEDENAPKEDVENDVPMNLIKPEGTFKIIKQDKNVLMLDKCDYYFDGELQEENGYVLNIVERANTLERQVVIHQEYHVKADYIPEELHLVCETPEKFEISVNGIKIPQKTEGYFVDKSFQKIEISRYMQLGENQISFDCVFRQSDEFYENLRKARNFESEKNKLSYDMEIETIYLLGDFSVRTDGAWTELERKSVRYQGDFVIDAPKKEVQLKNLEQQGYPFFCGKLVLEGELCIEGTHPVLELEQKGINAVIVEIDGEKRTMLTDNRLSLDEFDIRGTAKVKFTLINNLRNMLGPHHLDIGESYIVRPMEFYKENCIWRQEPEYEWNEDYCFVEMGI